MSKEENIKRRNHQVTRGYLANWSCNYDSNTKCIWYVDIEKQKVSFSQGEAAGFAVSDWLYVPELSRGNRDPILENWFSNYETELCKLAQLSRYGPPNRKLSNDFEEKAIKGCINLGFRSKHKLDRTVEHFRTTRPDLTEEQLVLASLQSLYNGMISLFEILKNSVFTIAYNLPIKLFSEETPFHVNMLQSGKIMSVGMALSPTSLLFGLPIKDAPQGKKLSTGFRINWINGDKFPELSSNYNKASVLGARQWLVCSSKQEAELVLPELSEKKVAERAAKDKVGIFSPMPFGVYNALYGNHLP